MLVIQQRIKYKLDKNQKVSLEKFHFMTRIDLFKFRPTKIAL